VLRRFLTGVVERNKVTNFERVLWRTTRGNLFMRQAEIEEKIMNPHDGLPQNKNVFIIFYQGERSQAKIRKICESFGANLYPCPESSAERRELLAQVRPPSGLRGEVAVLPGMTRERR
jgi:V-type H+-transporting ATPase subunit a